MHDFLYIIQELVPSIVGLIGSLFALLFWTNEMRRRRDSATFQTDSSVNTPSQTDARNERADRFCRVATTAIMAGKVSSLKDLVEIFVSVNDFSGMNQFRWKRLERLLRTIKLELLDPNSTAEWTKSFDSKRSTAKSDDVETSDQNHLKEFQNDRPTVISILNNVFKEIELKIPYEDIPKIYKGLLEDISIDDNSAQRSELKIRRIRELAVVISETNSKLEKAESDLSDAREELIDTKKNNTRLSWIGIIVSVGFGLLSLQPVAALLFTSAKGVAP